MALFTHFLILKLFLFLWVNPPNNLIIIYFHNSNIIKMHSKKDIIKKIQEQTMEIFCHITFVICIISFQQQQTFVMPLGLKTLQRSM